MAVIDLDSLLHDVPGDDPAGDKGAYYAAKNEMEEAAREVDPSGWDPSDPMRPEEVRADWGKVIEVGSDALATKCKHLEFAVRMTEALGRKYGFAGVADGLTLLRRLCEERWDKLHPLLGDGTPEDLEDRAAPFGYIGTENKGANFPAAVRRIPIVSAKGQDFGVAQSKDVGSGKIPKDAYDAAIAATSPEKLAATAADASRALTELGELNKVLDAKLPGQDTGLGDLRTALADAYQLAKLLSAQKPVADSGGESSEPGGGDTSSGGGTDGGGAGGRRGPADDRGSADRAVELRDSLYRRLEETAELLEKLEPRSPVPYLVRRAVALGKMDFPSLLAVLFQAGEPGNIRREFGVPEPQPAESSGY